MDKGFAGRLGCVQWLGILLVSSAVGFEFGARCGLMLFGTAIALLSSVELWIGLWKWGDKS